jgi:phage baseplate assembly protein gpV
MTSVSNATKIAALDNQGLASKVGYLEYGLVTDVDEDGFVRARLANGIETDWLSRQNNQPGFDGQYPLPGQTVLVGFIDGDAHNGYYTGVLNNQTNAIEGEGQRSDSVWLQARDTVDVRAENLVTVIVGTTRVDVSPGSVVVTVGGTIFEVADRVRINGQEVCVIGGVDSDGDIFVQSGQ